MKQSYAWIISSVHPKMNKKAVGVIGPRGSKVTALDFGDDDSNQFRLLDDDGIEYARGWFLAFDESAMGFEPLWDFGTPNWGCTKIQYRDKKGGWKTL